jgi:ubiquinone/menaquinone biosynthesis C-methylase UbiE
MGWERPVFARLYDLYMLPQEWWGVRARRRRVVGSAAGLTLEVGVGTGLNFPFYGRVPRVVGVDPDPHMLDRARRRAGEARVPIHLVRACGECLPFANGSFDTVISTLVFATIPDADAAAREVRRVLRPEGTLRFFEHFRSERPLFARLQDLAAPAWKRVLGGCEPNRDVVGIFRRAGLQVLETVKFRGTFLLSGIAKPG